MRQRIGNYFRKKTFRREFRRQIRSLILIALGFTIAFTWRQTVFDLSYSFVQLITHLESTNALSILSSVLITIVSIALIYATSHWLKDKNHDY